MRKERTGIPFRNLFTLVHCVVCKGYIPNTIREATFRVTYERN